MQPNSELYGQIRHVITAIGAFLFTRFGIRDDPELLLAAVGIVMTLIGMVLSWIAKRSAKQQEAQKISLAIPMPPTTTVAAVERKFEEIKQEEKAVMTG